MKFIQVEDELKADLTSFISENNQIVPVEFDGSVLKFNYTYYDCTKVLGSKYYPCPWLVSVVAKLIAPSPYSSVADSINNIRLHFKVKEEWSRQFNGDYKNVFEGGWGIQARMK